MIEGMPAGLPDDVREFAEAHPEVANLLVEAHRNKWPAERLLEALRETDYFKEQVALMESFRRTGTWNP